MLDCSLSLNPQRIHFDSEPECQCPSMEIQSILSCNCYQTDHHMYCMKNNTITCIRNCRKWFLTLTIQKYDLNFEMQKIIITWLLVEKVTVSCFTRIGGLDCFGISSSRMALAFLAKMPQNPPLSFVLLIEL